MDQMAHESHGRAVDQHHAHEKLSTHGNHDRHAGHSVAMFRDKFWLSFALTIRILSLFFTASPAHGPPSQLKIL